MAKNQSLTRQAGFLMAGRFLAMPLAFLVPIILARKFSIEEFGYYKQLFLIFNVLLPIIDFGIINSLYYFIPRYPEEKNTIIGQTLILTSVLCLITLLCFFLFPGNIAQLFTSEIQIDQYIPLLAIFAISWHLSILLEVVLIVEKRAFGAGVVTFISETARSISSISVVLYGYGIRELLIALVTVGVCRCSIMAYYFFKKYDIDWQIKLSSIKTQLAYSMPFGAAVIVNGLVGNIHQYIVSVTSDTSEFALFAVGCFQLPFLMITVDSIAKTSLVRMAEYRNQEDGFEKIARLISNSCRKLWLLFFPLFVFLFVVAEEFIELLFTEQYLKSIPTFRVFLFIIPLSALLIQHVPRALDETNFILKNNIFVLALSVALCWLGGQAAGIAGVALGFVVAHLGWKIAFFIKCKTILQCRMTDLVPFREMIQSGTVLIIGGGITYIIKVLGTENIFYSLSIAFCFFSIYCCLAFKYSKVLFIEEKMALSNFVENIKARFWQKPA